MSEILLAEGQVEVQVDDLNILGPGEERLTVDGADAHRIFLHTGAGTLAIAGLTLTRGRVVDQSGGCINSENGGVSLSDVTVTACSAHFIGDDPDAYYP